MRDTLKQLGLTAPCFTLIFAVIVLIYLQLNSANDSKLLVDQDGLGPISWPRVMLCGVIVSSLLWGAKRWKDAKCNVSQISINKIAYDNSKLVKGVSLITIYGIGITLIGFGYATFIFLLSWNWLGGTRSAPALLANSVIGTVTILYLFLKISYLPLPRGLGFMDDASIALYRFLGIF